ncbi:Calx-beta domain-containing protein [Phenylobacterium sp.]|uniref:Calx-beta domain-containing protein n=1 Tax=Phenylobacterium sp. TaxID=1871053 RepID=UPI002C66D6D5|nr:Calx-beta domain-containing protein [Phenylobacterium sp.]HVI33970.1 Calx-beta domain-containing protein [Phenylobacterium sp.]
MTYYNSRGVAMPESAAEEARVAGTAAGNETINAPAGNSSLSGEGGGDLLIGNNRDNRHWITDPKDRVVEQAGGGVDTQIGWTSIQLAANVENLQVNGAFNYAVGNGLGNLIIVDNETHWIYGAGGDDVLVGGATSKTTFVVRAGEGSDVIYNWNGNSQLQLWGYGLNTADQIRQAMTQQGADVVLRLSASETLTFRDETLAGFQDRQFLLPLDTSKLGALTFSDEFNTLQIYDHSLQTGIWRADFGNNLKDEWAYTLTSNGERQVYTTDHFYGQGERQLDHYTPHAVSGGILTIKAERLLDEDREAAWGREYSSGMLNTMGMFEQKYGYFEMRAELPTAHGAWPAFWMMPTPYVAQTEADIMEGLAATPHVDYRRAWGGDTNLYDNAYKIDPTGYHSYGMLWTPTTVTFYFDGVAVLQSDTPANWTHPMALIVNMAVGGWGGEPNSLQFPAEMKVDYVRAYALADGSTVIERGEPEPPAATLRADGGATSGQTNVPVTFEDTGQAVTTSKIAVYGAKPTTLPPGETFVIWEDSGAVFGAVSNGSTLGTATPLMAGSSSAFTGTGTWLTDGKVALAYMMPDGAGKAAWVMVFDPVKNTFVRHELGPSTGDIDVIATKNGGFAASWDAPGGTVMGRGYDAFAYDGEGWYGPARQLAGDLTGVTATGELIATTASGQQQLYDMINPPRGVDAVISVGPMAGVTHTEGNSGGTLYTFTLTRDWDQSQKSTVGWTVRGQGANPTDANDFEGGVLPSGVVTFEINQTTAYVQVWVQGDAVKEGDEEFLITLVNPVGAKLGQATATGFVTNDDTGGTPPPPTTQVGFTTSSVTHAEGNSGLTAFAYTVTRTGSTTGTSSVNWTVSGSGSNPAAAADFQNGTLPSGTLTFAAGETSKTITVQVAGDTTGEADEAFTVTLSGASGANLGTATAGGLITNDDGSTPPPTGGGQVINSPGPGSTLTGGAGDDTLNASQGADVLTGGAGADKFAWAREPWSPATVTDFAVGTDRLDLSALFQASGYAGADPVADKYITLLTDQNGTKVLFDRDGTGTAQQWGNYVINLQGVTTPVTWAQLSGGGSTTPPPSGSAQVGFTTTTLSLAEGNTGATAFSFTLARTGTTTGASTVNWSVSGSGANPANGADFATGALPSGTVTFAAGETSKTIVVNVAGDTTVESAEAFTVTLSGPSSGTTLGTASATGTITNDDTSSPPPTGAGQVYTSPGPGSTVTAGSGDDTINASQGADVLTGGAGADRFVWGKEPWSPATVTDFVVGTDKLDLSALFQASGYTGSDPVADKYVTLLTDSSGTKVLFDRDGAGTAQQWGNYIINLQGVTTPVTWSQLAGGGSTPPPGGSVTFSFATTSVVHPEGNGGGATEYLFTVVRNGSTAGPISIDYTTVGVGSNPTSADDFWSSGGVLRFSDGQSSATALIRVKGDGVAEADETFQVVLQQGAVTGNPGIGTITNDDAGTPPPPTGGQVLTSTRYGDTLTGGAGNDTLNAGQGPDQLTGAGGADRFVFANAPWNAGRITDFAPGTDKIDLRAIFDQTSYAGTNPVADRWILLEAVDGGTRVLVDLDGPNQSGQWPVTITTLNGVAPASLGAGDWIVQ